MLFVFGKFGNCKYIHVSILVKFIGEFAVRSWELVDLNRLVYPNIYLLNGVSSIVKDVQLFVIEQTVVPKTVRVPKVIFNPTYCCNWTWPVIAVLILVIKLLIVV